MYSDSIGGKPRRVHPQSVWATMGSTPLLRDVSENDSDAKLQRERERPRWITSLGIPLPVAGAMLAQTITVVFWLGQQSSKLDTVIEQQKEARVEAYHQSDATKDLQRRDDQIEELKRRVADLELYIRGGGRR